MFVSKIIIANRSTDDGGFQALNPLYMKYTPDGEGYFSGQMGKCSLYPLKACKFGFRYVIIVLVLFCNKA